MSKAFILSKIASFGLGLVTAAVCTTAALPTPVRNTATIHYSVPAGAREVQSNTVETADIIGKRPTTLTFYQLPDDYNLQGMKCDAASLTFTPSPINETQIASAVRLESLDVDYPRILALDAAGENRDPNVRETAWIDVQIGSQMRKVPLLETGPNTGVFAGAFPGLTDTLAPDLQACNPKVALGRTGTIKLSFSENGYSYGSSATILIDPTGYVFDSRTGKLLDGATVTILDDATGKPAHVYGEDGKSDYPSTMVTGAQVTDSLGHVYTPVHGNFRFPLLPKGRYRLVVTPPKGYSAPSVATPDAIAGLSNDIGGFLISDGSYSKAFDLAGMEPLHVDIPVDPGQGGVLLLEKEASIPEASPGDFVQYRLKLTNRDSAEADHVVITDILPLAIRYHKGSARGAGAPDVSLDGRTLKFSVSAIPAGGTAEISYVVDVAPGAPTGEAVNHASALGDRGASSNDASASVRIKPLLNTDALTIIGRVTEGDCRNPDKSRVGVAGVRLLMEDGTLVVTDKDGLYHFEGVRAGTHVVQIDTNSISGRYEPVACDINTRQARNPISRFVEGGGGSLQRVDFQLRPVPGADKADAALPIDIDADADAAGNRSDWLAKATPGIDWKFPLADHNPRAPALRVVIRHAPDQRVALTLNGDQVDPLSFDGTDTDRPRGVAISTWTGLPLRDRDNELMAVVLDAKGQAVATLTRKVHYANAPAHAVFLPAKSRLTADGLTRPLIAVQVTDRDGKPVRAGTIVPFTVDQPYTAAQQLDAEQGRQLAGLDRAETTARVVGDEGIAFVALQPTTQAGQAHVSIQLKDEARDTSVDFKAWLSASQKDWVVVGFGRGTFGYSTLKKHSESVPGGRHDVTSDGQLALYVKGRIKGSWLLTMAYDTDKKYDRDRGLLGTIDPDRYYTVYGDGTQQTYDAATRRKLYIRLERREASALFGDFETGLTDTKLMRYSRTLNGVKVQYAGNHLMFTGFAANDDQLYGRDEIRGNGLTGPYRLSAQDIVANSDKISIEVRDRFRSEKIISSTEMTRHIDYDIDPAAGTIRFKEPILSRDSDLNPIFIVVDYETYGRSKKLSAGGRVATRFANGRVEIGASALHDETISKATVVGADLKVKITKTTELRAEGATGGRDGISQGRAFLAELEHHDRRVDVLAYAQRQDEDFGLGQQNFAEAGTQKAGIDGRLRLTSRLSATGSGWYQNDLDGSGRRYAGEARVEYRRDKGTLFAGTQIASDHTIGGEKRDSRLITLGGSQDFFQKAVTVTGQTMFSLGGKDQSTDFPVRHQIDVSWRVKPGIRLIGTQEFAEGDEYKARSTRIGFDIAPWRGAKLMSTMNSQMISENGPRTFAQYGMSQSLPLGHGWTADATVDASTNLKGSIPTGARVNPFQPVSSGTTISGTDQEDGNYTALTGGLAYRAALWSWNGRLEYRTSSLSKRWGVTSNLLRSLGEGKTIASSVKIYQVKEKDGGTVMFASADLAFAWRPIDSHWSLLERLQLREDKANGQANSSNALAVPTFAQGDDSTMRAINNLAINYRSGAEGAGHGFEASLYYGAKYVKGRYADETYDGFIDVIGLEIRKDIGTHFDIGAAGSVQHSWSGGAFAFSYGPSVGVSPAKDVWITVGYNIAGYRDHDFEDARYTRQGAYLTMRMKFDQGSIKDAARAIRGMMR